MSNHRMPSYCLTGIKGGFVTDLKLKVIEDNTPSKMCLLPQGSDPPGRNYHFPANLTIPQGLLHAFIYLGQLNVAIIEQLGTFC